MLPAQFLTGFATCTNCSHHPTKKGIESPYIYKLIIVKIKIVITIIITIIMYIYIIVIIKKNSNTIYI